MPPPPEDSPGSPIPGPSPSATSSPTLRLAVGAVPTLDPRDLETPDSLLLASQVFDGLVEYDPETADLLPAIAESWQVLDGGHRLVFHLRQGVTFHDGTPVTADAFVTAWNRLADPISSAPFAFLLEDVEGFQKFQDELKITRLSGLSALTPRALEVRLVRAWPDFVSLLAHPALSPVPSPAPPESFATQPVGTGPYRVAAPLTPGSPISLEAYDGYYGTAPLVASVEYRTFDAPEEAWPEFLSGELDLAEIPADVLSDAVSAYSSEGIATVARLLYCAFNEKDERFRNPNLRTAASLAIDRQAVVENVYARLPEPATAIVPPTIPGHGSAACGGRCQHDPDRAASLIQNLPRKARTFALDYASSATGDRLAAVLAQQLGEVGLLVTPRPHLAPEYERLLEAGEQEMFCLAWVGDYPRQQAFLEPLLSSDSVDNRAGIDAPDLEAILEEARLSLDASARERLYAEAERKALSAMHVIPVVWFRSHLAIQPHVEGFSLDPLGRYDAARLSISP